MPRSMGALGLLGLRVAVLPLLLAGLASCDNSTGAGAFDPVASSEAAEQLFAAFEDNAALEGLAAAGAAFPTFGTPIAAAPAVRIETPEEIDRHLRLLDRVAPFLGAANPATVFPIDVLGKTFVYDPGTQRYVLAPERDGAPTNGIRLVLYAVDPVLHRPVTPVGENEIGYLDLTDEGDATADRLGILVVVGSTTYLDYDASVVNATSSVTVSADGYVSDGTTRVDFTLHHTWSKVGEGFTADYDLSVPDGGPALALDLSLNPQTEALTMGLDILHGGTTLAYDLTLANGLTGTVSHNGNVVVQIGGTILLPTFTDTDGQALPPLQVQALKRIFAAGLAITGAFDDLLAPAYVLLVVSLLGP